MGIEEVLLGLADSVLDFDEASLAQLQEKYLKKVSEFAPTRDWERSIVSVLLDQFRACEEQDFQRKGKRLGSSRSTEILKKHAENS